MTRRLSLAAASFAIVSAGVQPAGAQPPRIINGQVTTQAAGTLQSTFGGLVSGRAEAGLVEFTVILFYFVELFYLIF